MRAEGPGRGLTEEQELAVGRREGALALAAAAGSGKTSVLVERFVRAVRQDGVAPGRILAITFTERAAGELRERVRARLLELGDRQAARDTEAAFVGTFHGFCARLLRAHPLAAGVDPAFSILDEAAAGRLRERAFERALRAFTAEGGERAVDLLAAYRVDRVRAIVHALHAELRSRGQRHPRLPDPFARVSPERPRDEEAARACALFDLLLSRFAAAYEQLKRVRGGLDFDDLELCAAELLNGRETVRRAWAERLQLLMVDEFQDTNPRQLQILQALERENLFTVGDELQSIYGFRHADVRLFRERHERLAPDGASLALRTSFRSRPGVIEAVNGVFAARLPGYSPLRAGRVEEGPHPDVELLLTDTRGWEGRGESGQPWRRAEAALLAGRVAELLDAGRARAGDVVVLLRAVGDLDLFEGALRERGLRTLASVGGFWGHQQTADLIAYLRVLANPLDDLALHGVLASPLGGCSLDGLALLARRARRAGTSVWEAALSLAAEDAGEDAPRAGDRAAMARLCGLVERERVGLGGRSIALLLERGMGACGYLERIRGCEEPQRRLANVHKLLRLARRFEADEGRDLRGFLDHVERLQAGRGVEPDAPVEGADPDAVRLMTVHAAKGLEFPVVCVADLGRQPNGQTPDLLVDGQLLGLRLVGLDGGSEPALDYEELSERRRREEAEEEDRILYVAMTRARELLVLSGSVDLARWPASRRSPISWLVPALAPGLPEALAAGEALDEITIGRGRVRCTVHRAGDPAVAATAERPARPPRICAASPPPQRPEQPEGHAPAPFHVPGSFSYTSLAELERCGYRFYLERVLRLPEDREAARRSTHGGLDPLARGTLLHSLLEGLDFVAPRLPDAAAVEQAAARLGLRVDGEEAAELAGAVAAMATSPTAGRLAAGRILGRERPFAFSLGPEQPLVEGFMDLLAVEPDGSSLVVDYKSDRIAADADLEEAVRRDYGVQRLVYALAALRGGAPAVEVVHWFAARPGEPVARRYSRTDAGRLERELRTLTDRVAAGSFAVSERPHRGLCQTCPGRAGLCSWGEAETMRENPRTDPKPEQAPQGPLTLF